MRALVAWLLVALTVPAAVAVWRLEVDNRLERWTGSDPAAQEVYDRFKETFGSDEFVVVALTGVPLFEPEVLAAMVEATEALEALDGVRRVRGLPVVYRDLFNLEDPEELAEEMTSTPFYRGLFISDDGATAGVLIEVEPAAETTARRRLVAGIRTAIQALAELGFEEHMVGSTALIVALDELSANEARRSFAVALLCSLAAMLLLLRSLRATVVAAAAAAVTVCLTLGLLVVTGHSLNMITSVLPALLWVLALSGAIHVLRRYMHHLAGSTTAEAVKRALRETSRPVLLSALTTAFGFASLMVAGMAPVRELGGLAAAGLLLSAVVNLSLVPELIIRLRVPARVAAQRRRPCLDLGVTRPWPVLAVAAVVLVVMVVLVPRIRVASNPLGFLPENHTTTSAYAWVGENLTGFYTMEVVLSLPLEWSDPAVWSAVDELAEHIDNSEIVARVFNPLDLLRKLNHWEQGFDPGGYELPGSAEEAEMLLADLDDPGRDSLSAMVAASGRELRLSALVNEMDEGRFLELVRRTRSAVDQLPAGFSARVTGQVLQLVNAQQELVRTQLESLGLALMVVFLCMAVGLRSLRFTALAALPNLIPLASAFTVMAVLRIPLDAATVMMASVALGIAVDDTVHLLVAVESNHSGSGPEAVSRALQQVAPAMLTTTLIATIGFLALLTSAFVPIAAFGLLAATAMVVALAADLLALPALLVVFDRSR